MKCEIMKNEKQLNIGGFIRISKFWMEVSFGGTEAVA